MYNSIYPGYVKPYSGVNQRQITKKNDEEKNSQTPSRAENDLQHQRRNMPAGDTFFPNGEKSAIDYTKNKINITQVLKDFTNTTNAIGAPEEIKAEVSQYLSLIENQAEKDNPNANIIRANLKSASQILDEYITKTLNKKSDVVENWVDALFLQQIDYKAEKTEPVSENNTDTFEHEDVNIVNGEVVEPDENDTYQKEVRAEFYVPTDSNLKRMFIQAKKYAAVDDKEKALSYFQTALDYADEIGDNQTSAMICYEEGKIYDEFDMAEEALYSFDRAVKQSNDNNIKARAHISMGKIYDEYINFNPAVNHYCKAVSYAGETDNLVLQSKALSNLAQIHAEKYDKDNAFMFMDLADITAEETGNEKVKAVISSENALGCELLDEKTRALKYYGNSSKSYYDINDNENLAKNYEKAAKIMVSFGNTAKAKKLLEKAYVAAQNTNNDSLKKEVTNNYLKLKTGRS